MHQLQRFLLLLLIVLLASSGIPVSASQPTPDTRLILSHKARFTAEVPENWDIDLDQRADYISPDKNEYIVASTYPASMTSLTQACRSAARRFDAKDDPDSAITWVTFAAQIGCRLESPNATGAANEPLAVIFLHPNPLLSGIDDLPYFKYAGVMVDRAHFEAVTESMKFDLADVTPELYVSAAIDLLQAHSLVRDEIDWETVRTDAEAAISGDGVLPALDVALEALDAAGDRHSYRWEPVQLDSFVGTSAEDIPETKLPSSLAFSDQISYINLPPIQGDESVFELYATTGSEEIADVDSATTCGWIIDLRTNFGGNSDPMVAAVGEILGDGVFAGFANSDGTVDMQAYEDGSVFDADDSAGDSLIDGPIYTPENPDSAVALLIGPVTGSAGEYTVIGFIGRPETRTFGEPSADLTTGISGFVLMDGGAIGLATSAMIDRSGTAYPSGIEPDTVIESDVAGILDPADPVAAAATEWLLQQPSCQ